MGDIAITSAVRSNLNALQSTASLMSTVQERLSTGKKVNSALDNPNSFFTAKALENRASDLSTLLDDQSQSVQTLKAADKGISAISDLVDAAKAKANQALQSSNADDRKKFATEYNELLSQIESIAKDSSYKGKNLLGGTGNDLKVIFNEDGSSKLDISAVDYTDTTDTNGLNLTDLPSTGTPGSTTISLTHENDVAATGSTTLGEAGLITGTGTQSLTFTQSDGTTSSISVTENTTIDELVTLVDTEESGAANWNASTSTLSFNNANQSLTGTTFQDIAANGNSGALTAASAGDALTGSSLVTSDAEFSNGDVITSVGSDGIEQKLTIDDTTTVDQLTQFLGDGDTVSASLSGSTLTATDSAGAISISSTGSAFTSRTGGENSGFSTDADIEAALEKLSAAQDTLRAQASTFGTNLSIVENRETFTKALINTLEEGAGKLTLADTNKEGANLLALQTQQQLASTSLSLASQASQNVLRLIG